MDAIRHASVFYAIPLAALSGCAPGFPPPAQQPPAELRTPATDPVDGTFEARWPVLRGFAVDPAESRMRRERTTVAEDLRARCDVSAVYFGFDSAEPGPDARAELARVAACYRDGPLRDRRLRLIGRADLTGDASYNLSLGLRRANGVKRVLVQAGVPASRIRVVSTGTRAVLGPFAGYTYGDDRRVDIVLAP